MRLPALQRGGVGQPEYTKQEVLMQTQVIPVPAIFILDENGAAREVHFFCSNNCRRKSAADRSHQDKCKLGSADYVEGAVCQECGKPVCVTKAAAS